MKGRDITMKIGIHLSVFTENWNDNVLPYVSLTKEIGYDIVEIPLWIRIT
jgi:sugar phosphate isomerase/epimerase